MQNARAHKLQWSGPIVHSSTVVILKMSLTIHLQDSLYQIHLQDKFFCPSTKPPDAKVRT